MSGTTDIWQILGLGIAGLSGAVMLIFKVLSVVRKEQEGQASSIATKSQFDLLQSQIRACQADNTLLREQFNLMDVKLHRQQTKLTRTEMLLRQFCGLVRDHGIPIPRHMLDELADLIGDDGPPPEPPPAPNVPFVERRKEHAFGDK